MLVELGAVGCTAKNIVDLQLVGHLVAAGYKQQQIVSALDMLAYAKRLDCIGGSRVRLWR